MKYLILLLALISQPFLNAAGKPNILWIYCEDLSPWMESYGHEVNAGKTPTLDGLSAGGIRYTRAYVPAPVCSSCRSGMITGLYQTTTGTHNHRSSRTPQSSIYLPKGMKTVPQLFLEAGYETFNRGKDDYNFSYKRDEHYSIGNVKTNGYSGYAAKGKGGWQDVSVDKPWFGQIQLAGGKVSTRGLADKVDASKMKLPAYFPDEAVFRQEWAHHYDTVRVTDGHVAKIMEQLKVDGMLENTVVFFFADHGNNHSLRHKQFCYEGGVHVPLIISGPGVPKGKVDEGLVNMLSVPATSLSLAGIPVPKYFEGQDLFAANYQPEEYVISARDRCDYTIDCIRTVRSEKFRYIKNFKTDRILLQPQYRDNQKPTKRLRELYKAGQLAAIPERAFFGKRPSEELYDLGADPDQINNLAADPNFADVLKNHRNVLEQWIVRTGDKGQQPEPMHSLAATFKRWGKRCVNPEFDVFKKKSVSPTNQSTQKN